jgi:hypothetical protein
MRFWHRHATYSETFQPTIKGKSINIITARVSTCFDFETASLNDRLETLDCFSAVSIEGEKRFSQFNACHTKYQRTRSRWGLTSHDLLWKLFSFRNSQSKEKWDTIFQSNFTADFFYEFKTDFLLDFHFARTSRREGRKIQLLTYQNSEVGKWKMLNSGSGFDVCTKIPIANWTSDLSESQSRDDPSSSDLLRPILKKSN